MGLNPEDEGRRDVEPPPDEPDPAAAACGLAVPPPLETGAGGAPTFTALMMPLRMVCARLGCGGGAEEDALATEPPAPDDAAPAPDPAAAVELAPDAVPAPAATPLIPDRSAPAATAAARTIVKAVDPTSPEISFLAINGIRPRARA